MADAMRTGHSSDGEALRTLERDSARHEAEMAGFRDWQVRQNGTLQRMEGSSLRLEVASAAMAVSLANLMTEAVNARLVTESVATRLAGETTAIATRLATETSATRLAVEDVATKLATETTATATKLATETAITRLAMETTVAGLATSLRKESGEKLAALDDRMNVRLGSLDDKLGKIQIWLVTLLGAGVLATSLLAANLAFGLIGHK